ncbi:thiamine phosphate synthase [Vibrio sp. T187]|uniref:thiamine phosphate synthase n=1 Tax=Vibrio TaxID=662 RepID=UPI0010C9AD73|nr:MULTISPECIES: thiamine phosphate synthase [Vibrio]MBW3698596.1 thiamine phosphate synthase [Vibrio sp. T187]
MKILIPASSIELTGEVQHCLLVAQQQGFEIKNIELGVSPTQYFSLKDSQQTIKLAERCNSITGQANELDYVIDYTSASSIVDVKAALEAQHNLVFVSVLNEEQQLDVWSHNGVTRALSVSEKRVREFSKTRHMAWLLTCLVLDFPIEDALVLARASCSVSRETWPNEFSLFPTPILENSSLGIQVGWTVDGHNVSFPKLTKPSLGLYPVVDSVDWIERLLKLGIKTTQLRIKDSSQPDLEQQIEQAIRLGEQYQAQVFINDYWQLAVKHGAFGVHLGQEDIEESNLTALSKAGIKLGLSTHGYYELLRIVQIAPSYIALGHIFPTTTKDMPSRPQGLVRLALYQQLIDTIPYSEQTLGYPTVAIGGIDQSTAPLVWECGVSSLAVVRAITLAESPKAAIEEFDRIMGKSSAPVKAAMHA